MAAKTGSLGAFGGMHTAGIFSDMTVDGPNIGTLVVIMDRAKNLPNKRSMGKQDPYCAARLGKEAKKTNTDKRGGQTPRWDQELRFTVHDSADYHNLKVSIFNDDKKTELIGETWVGLDGVLLPGGGQSDGWHGLNCKGKYAGEIRIELTYYDSRPKEMAAAEKRREGSAARADHGPASPAVVVGGPRESSQVKRRPLPSDPTAAASPYPTAAASPSPQATPEHRGLSGLQAGPRAYQTPPHQNHQNPQQTPTSQRQRRPVPDVAPYDVAPHAPHTPQPAAGTPQYHGEAYEAPYAAPAPYEVQPIQPLTQQPRDHVQRTAPTEDFRPLQRHSPAPAELPHSYSAESYSHSHVQDQYQDPAYQVAPLRTSRSTGGFDQPADREAYPPPDEYYDSSPSLDPYAAHGRSPGAMQPTVEDEDDIPPPPPVHRRGVASVSPLPQERPPSYHSDAPAPLNITRFREESPRPSYDSQPQSYGTNDYSPALPTERRYTSTRPLSRPVSRDTMAPSLLRNETAMLPASLVAGGDRLRLDNRTSVRADDADMDVYRTPPPYETQTRLRQQSEPDYRTLALPQYETPPRQHPLAHHQSMPMVESPNYYSHAPPEEPRQISPVHEHVPLVKPRAVSPGHTRGALENRGSRNPLRTMPTRKSVSPRPPPSADSGERHLSGVAFSPDSFDVYNPTISKNAPSGSHDDTDGRPGSRVEVNEKGQVVTFSGRVIDASDHLPLESWAPEPEVKGRSKDRPVRERPPLSGARDIETARQREQDYRIARLERNQIRSAVDSIHGDTGSPSNALVTSRHNYSSSNGLSMNTGAMVIHDESGSPASGGRNRLQKRNQGPVSSYDAPVSTSPGIPMSSPGVLRERENPGGYGSPGYGSGARHGAAPPIPAKIPLGNGIPSEDMTALSLELQTIDIGPPSGGRHRTTNRRPYDGY